MQFTSSKHILDYGLTFGRREFGYWYLYGVNYHMSCIRPVMTTTPELLILRGILLRNLAMERDISSFGEVGTARGWQSILIADAFLSMNKPVQVATCDIIPHDKVFFRTPLAGRKRHSRRALWDRNPEVTKDILFVEGDSAELAKSQRTFDMVYIDGMHEESWVMHDYENLSPWLAKDAVVVFDDCDERYPGVMRAVETIAAAHENAVFSEVTFEHSQYKVAIMQLSS